MIKEIRGLLWSYSIAVASNNHTNHLTVSVDGESRHKGPESSAQFKVVAGLCSPLGFTVPFQVHVDAGGTESLARYWWGGVLFAHRGDSQITSLFKAGNFSHKEPPPHPHPAWNLPHQGKPGPFEELI